MPTQTLDACSRAERCATPSLTSHYLATQSYCRVMSCFVTKIAACAARRLLTVQSHLAVLGRASTDPPVSRPLDFQCIRWSRAWRIRCAAERFKKRRIILGLAPIFLLIGGDPLRQAGTHVDAILVEKGTQSTDWPTHQRGFSENGVRFIFPCRGRVSVDAAPAQILPIRVRADLATEDRTCLVDCDVMFSGGRQVPSTSH